MALIYRNSSLMIANKELPEDCGSSPTTSEHVLMPNFRGEVEK